MNFGNNLKKLREHHGISQAKVANDLNISRVAYTNYELGKREPSYDMLIHIARYFHMTVDDLIREQELTADQSVPVLSSNSAFDKRLKEVRTVHGISQNALSQKIGVSVGAVGMWEIGKRKPNYDVLMKIADFFHVSTDYLLGRDAIVEATVPYTKFGSSLCHLREQRQLTQYELANKLHLNRETYAHYEIGKRQPDYETLVKLADFFNVSLDYLFGRNFAGTVESVSVDKQLKEFIGAIQLATDKLMKTLKESEQRS